MATQTKTTTQAKTRRRTKTRKPSDIAREMFRVLFEERDLSDPYRFWTDDTVDHFLALGESIRGAQAITGFFRDLFAAVPDWRTEIQNVVDDGDRQVVVQWRGSGTFTGAPLFGIEPTGRHVEIDGVDVIRLDDGGKVATNTIYYDGAEYARQVGMLPPRDSGMDRGMLAAFNASTRLRRRFKRD